MAPNRLLLFHVRQFPSGSGHSLSGGNVGTVGNLNLDFIASPSNFAAEEASLAENKDKIEMKLIDELWKKKIITTR